MGRKKEKATPEEMLAAAKAFEKSIPYAYVYGGDANDMCMQELICSNDGLIKYGRFYYLLVLLLNSKSHAIPKEGERGYLGYMQGLKFETPEEFEEFLTELVNLGKLVIDENDWRYAPLVNEAAYRMKGFAKAGELGGKRAAAKRNETIEEHSF